MKLLLHSHTSTVQPLKFGNGQVISSHTLVGMYMYLLTHAGIKVNHVSKRGSLNSQAKWPCVYFDHKNNQWRLTMFTSNIASTGHALSDFNTIYLDVRHCPEWGFWKRTKSVLDRLNIESLGYIYYFRTIMWIPHKYKQMSSESITKATNWHQK